MGPLRSAIVRALLALVACAPALSGAASRALPTGNGFGFAVVHPAEGAIVALLAHPHSYAAPDPAEPLGEGVPAAQFLESLGWRPDQDAGDARPSAHYLRQSQVIHLRARGGQGYAWMPFGLARAALVIAWQPVRPGAWAARWSHPVERSEAVAAGPGTARVVRFAGLAESLCLVPLGKARDARAGLLEGNDAWALVVVPPGTPPAVVAAEVLAWQAGLEPRALVERELRELERWRVPVPPGVRGAAARRTWRQGEVVLRMAQSREPDAPTRHGNGLIVAALPEGGWATPWVRDMAYAMVALVRMGHREEARAALLAYFNARPTGVMRTQLGGADYQVSVVRYFGDGTEEPWFTQEGATNIELDGWGLVLWALGEYLARWPGDPLPAEASHRGSVYDSARDFIVRPLLARLEPWGGGAIVAADTSIWEERQADQRHFAYTTAAAIAGLRAWARVARSHGDEPGATQAGAAVARLERGFDAAFVRDGHLRGTLEPGPKNDIDGALLAVFDLGVADSAGTLADVVARMPALRVASGGFRRVRSQLTDPAIFEYGYERQEFVFVDLAMSSALRRLGRRAEASELLARVVRDADAHDGIVPEMYVSEPDARYLGPIGAPTGAMPMAGYGAGALALQWLSIDAHPSRETLP